MVFDNYFYNLQRKTITNSQYQRKDNVLRIAENIEDLYGYNYCMYKNCHFNDKWFYAFITKMEYLNEKVTLVYLETDVYQTWQFDFRLSDSFIERQHPDVDSFNTIEDNVAHGQLIVKKTVNYNFTGGYFVFCSADPSQDDTSNSATYSFSIGDYTIPCLIIYFDSSKAMDLINFVQRVANKGRGDRIMSIVYVPHIPPSQRSNMDLQGITSGDVGSFNVCTGFNNTGSLQDTVSCNFGDIPYTYKKELCYPYSKIVVSDTTTGQIIELAPEKFADLSNVQFDIQPTISEMPSYRVIPCNYCGQAKAFNHALVVHASTSLPTVNNLYSKYMMNNGNINSMKEAFAGIGMASSVATLSGQGVVSSIEQISGIVAQENQASKLGNQVGSISDGAMERICYQNGLEIDFFGMDSSHEQMARKYWKMYGYPVHALGTPLLNSGGDLNFTKLVNPNISGAIPQEDIRKLENIFSKGVTIWHNPNTYREYI